tara:strand:- start:1264 stop:1386 length:123 start_codon:yes stop_codon:yes gene_type:complete
MKKKKIKKKIISKLKSKKKIKDHLILKKKEKNLKKKVLKL